MTFAAFTAHVAANGWTREQMTWAVPPPAAVEDLADRIGLATFERYVMRMYRMRTPTRSEVLAAARRMGAAMARKDGAP